MLHHSYHKLLLIIDIRKFTSIASPFFKALKPFACRRDGGGNLLLPHHRQLLLLLEALSTSRAVDPKFGSSPRFERKKKNGKNDQVRWRTKIAWLVGTQVPCTFECTYYNINLPVSYERLHGLRDGACPNMVVS